jgi:hypothetical protein
MRVSNDRYSRDLRSIDLARRMLLHEARTQTICAWTGLKGDRVRNLARSYASGTARAGMQRHRGPPPTQLSVLLVNRRMRSEVAAVAGLCQVLQVLPDAPVPRARTALPGLSRGERLVDAYELYRAVIPRPHITFEQLVLVVLTLAEGDAWSIDQCAICRATILMDHFAMAPRRLCIHCRADEHPGTEDLLSDLEAPPGDPEPGASVQQRLFE